MSEGANGLVTKLTFFGQERVFFGVKRQQTKKTASDRIGRASVDPSLIQTLFSLRCDMQPGDRSTKKNALESDHARGGFVNGRF
jgi:hypothetical protein